MSIKKQFLLPDGKTSKHAIANAVALQIDFGQGTINTYDVSKINKGVLVCLTLHGLSQKLGDAGAGKTVDEHIERADTVFEGLMEGRWIERAEGVTRSSLLAEAIAEVKPAKYKTVADATAMLAAIPDTDEGKKKRKSIESIPEVVKVLERKKAERAAERAKAAAAVKSDGKELAAL